ncbi:multidrug resistance-associated ABC transporter [Agrocybe pediades]|nr:multidrug resistance-associated ABC transporter [Agrocybe pediades]
MPLCEDYALLDFQDACVRNAWSAFLPTIIVLSLCIWSLPLPWPAPARRLFAYASIPFKSFLTLEEAEALSSDCRSEDVLDDTVQTVAPGPTWSTFLFAFSGMAEALCWVAYGSYSVYADRHSLWKGIACFLKASCWLFTAIRPIAQPFSSAPMDLFSIYVAFFVGSILQLGGVLYNYFALQQPLPALASILGQMADLLVVIALLVTVLNLPLADRRGIATIEHNKSIPLFGVGSRSAGFTLLSDWHGRSTTLNEKDVWELGPTFKSKPVFVKFSAITRPTLLRRLWIANSMDITLDFLMTFVSVLFNYSGPFFLKRILDLIDKKNPTPETRGQAYIYAFLAFTCSLLKAETDVQHFWFARRLSCRLRSELMASIYDKALKRKDFSGITNKDIASESKGKKTVNAPTTKIATNEQKKKPANKADEERAGADIGKIVNLMAGDTNRIGRTATLLYNVYSAPLEIMIASTFLYQLLGLSAFAGFFVLLVGWPFINYLTRRSVRIQKELLAQRDKRMTVVNELLSTVKFIKFFAWEERWIDKALDVRELEMQWLIKARTNSVMLNCLWTVAPILVSIVAFGVYVMRGNELTVGTAFTAIVLFNMIKSPLNVLPSWLVQILQTGVAIKRIEAYLNEDEVTDQVSSLKGTSLNQSISNSTQVGLGLENASLTWNTVNEHSDGKGRQRNPKKATRPSNSEDSDTSTMQDSASRRSDEQAVDRIFELRDASVIFPEGQLTVVTGPTACGKTALLLAVLGELTLLSGRIIMSKDPSHVDENGMTQCISYAAQTPWLRHQSIRDNILFGYPYDEERYNLVLECCALQPDLKMLEDGDQTEIGARGINLSGGQKARVALARAVYARTKYVLLDDPLSAVDSHTARFLYERLIRGPLLAKRTVILVTHHVDLVLPGAFYLVHMLDGRIDTQGIVADLRVQGIVDALVQESHHFVHEQAPETLEATTLVDPSIVTEQQSAAKKKPRKLVKDEHREVGNVKWPIYKTYIEASSYWIWVILVAIAVIMQLSGISEKLWIKTWGEAYRNHVLEIPTGIHGFASSSIIYDQLATSAQVPWHFGLNMTNAISYYPRIELPDPNQRPLFYVGVYAAIGLITGMLRILSVAAQYTGAVRASRNLFKRLLVTVMRATFRFHDTTPQGRLLNRFGKDLESIDASLAGSLQAVNSHLAGFFVSIITISVVFPYFLIPAFFLGIVYLWLGIGYRNTNRDLRRMESNTRSPIYSHFGEILEGIVTVRAFSAEKQFLDSLHLKLDTAMKMYYSFWMVNRWLLLNFDALSALAILITTLFSIHTLTNGAGLAGLCISSAMAFTNSVFWVCRNWTTLELDLNAVERIVEYLELPQEPPAIIKSNRVPAYWPSKSASQDGLMKVENLEVKYAPELPSVLKNVSFTLQAGERVGLLGRTGSGKSTLAMSLLRFVDPSNGRIIIDGIDISTIGIYDLRSRVTFIPQDATLFSGTIRDNLDPFHEHDDQECIDVLRRVHIITDNDDEISSPSPGRSSSANIREEDNTITESVSISSTNVDTNRVTVSLESKVSAGGTNFSQGQRQLIAMARALLRRNSIVILDEATSSIDFDTDTKIQATIRQEFSGSLLLTVAHRLRTIIDYDRLIVLDKGEVVEFGTPWNLINKEDGVFRDMCLKSGSYSELERAAGQKANVL